MSKPSKRAKVLLKLQALVIAIGSDRRKFNPEIQAIANDIDELYEAGEALSNNNGSDSAETHVATPSEQSIEELKQQLAAIEHERWADWQKWVHKHLIKDGERYYIQSEYIRRWERQIGLPYEQLTAKEKAADMEQVDRYWPLIEALVDKATREAVIAELKGIKNVGDGTLEYDDELIARRLYDRIKALEELSNKEVK